MTEISKEYGAALFLLACEEDRKEAYGEALDTVLSVFSDCPQYSELLSSPGISLGERLAALDAAFAGAVPEQILSYLKLLCEKGRISCLTESIEEYRALLDAFSHTSKARITSAVPLSEEEKEKLLSRLSRLCGGTVQGEYAVDAAILGGLVIEVDGKVLDGSLRYRLQEIKGVMNT